MVIAWSTVTRLYVMVKIIIFVNAKEKKAAINERDIMEDVKEGNGVIGLIESCMDKGQIIIVMPLVADQSTLELQDLEDVISTGLHQLFSWLTLQEYCSDTDALILQFFCNLTITNENIIPSS